MTGDRTWRFTQPIVGKCRMLFAGPHFQAARGLVKNSIDRRGLSDRIEMLHAPTKQELIQFAGTAHIALPFMEKFDSEFLQAANNLKLVQQFGVGLEGVDLSTATNLGIAVSNIPADGSGNAEATAEHAIFLSISLLRRASHDFPKRFEERILGGLPPPLTLFERNVTVIGYGNVGRKICEYLRVMGSNVTAVRRSWDQETAPESITKSTQIEEVLPTTELLILACPVTPHTFHLMNKERLSLLSPNACMVNVGRGPLVDYTAVRNALESKQLAGFASDVGVGHEEKVSEPWDPNDEICRLDNVLFTPHVGGYSDLSYARMTEQVLDNVERILAQTMPIVWVNNNCI